MDLALTAAADTVVGMLQRYQAQSYLATYLPTLLPANENVELTGVEKQPMTLVLSIQEGCKVYLKQ